MMAMMAMMGLSVLHPGLLIAGLICISIPILVHLLRRKHRPISWGAMRFLEQAYRKRRRLITIEQLILLLTRCAIIALIAGGVGSLVLGSGLADERARTMILVIDNSIHSAGTIASGQSSIEYQRQRALELLSTLDPTQGDRAALITVAAPAIGEAIPATSELGLIRSRLERLQATDADRDINGAFGLVSQVIDGLDEGSIAEPAFMLSPMGWGKDTRHEEQTLNGVESIWIDVPRESAGGNIAITELKPLRPMVTRHRDDLDDSPVAQDEIQGIRVVLNRSDSAAAQSTNLVVEDPQTETQLAIHEARWSPGQSRLTESITLDPSKLGTARGGSAILRVSLQSTTTNSNPRDDTRLLGMPIRQYIGVGIIDAYSQPTSSQIRPSRWVRAVLGADEGLISIQQINANSAGDRIDPTLDVLFILSPAALDDRGWARIARLNALGMPIVITPDASSNGADWAKHLETLSPGLIDGAVQSRSFDPPIGLANQLETGGPSHNQLLSGISDEYPDLGSSVTITRRLVFEPGEKTGVLMRDSQDRPLTIVALPEGTDSDQGGSVVLFGVAFDADWTDLPARPLFVAMMHELLRSLLAQSIAPDVRIAGNKAAGLGFDSLEPLLATQPDASNPRIANAFVLVDEQGVSRHAVIINPDSTNSAAIPDTLESPDAVIARSLPNIEMNDLSTFENLSVSGLGQTTSPGRSIALLLFGIAAGIGVIEFLLARRCSYSAIGSQTIQPRGAA